MRLHVPNIRFSRLNLKPRFHSFRRTGIGLARDRRREFFCVRESLLDDSPSFGFGSNDHIVLARSFDAPDVICFCWHCWLLPESDHVLGQLIEAS
jgi:hypothetical protein